MHTFQIYPKKGKEFALAFDRFELREEQFVLYNDRDKESRAGFLSFANIAAILPDGKFKGHGRVGLAYDTEPTEFLIYLKDRPPTEPLHVVAFVCDTSQPPSVQFFWKVFNVNKFEDHLIPNIYIAISEVVAIMPSGGLDIKS